MPTELAEMEVVRWTAQVEAARLSVILGGLLGGALFCVLLGLLLGGCLQI